MERLKKCGLVLGLTVKGYLSNDIGKRAATLTYYLIFAIFPFLITVISLLGFLHLPMISLEGEAAGFLPEDVITLLNLTIAHMTATSSGTLLTFGLAFTLWFPLRAVKSMTDEVSQIYGEEKPKGHTKRIIGLALFLLVLVPFMVVLMLIGERMLDFISNFIPIQQSFIRFWTKIRFLPMTVALLALVSAVYYFSPNRPPAWRYILPGAMLSTVAWLAISAGFSYYVDNMGKYSVIYGSIGAIIAFLVWLNWSMTSLLIGAVFNQSLRQVGGDTE